MCYKDELQKKNAIKLQRKFDEDNIPVTLGTLIDRYIKDEDINALK